MFDVRVSQLKNPLLYTSCMYLSFTLPVSPRAGYSAQLHPYPARPSVGERGEGEEPRLVYLGSPKQCPPEHQDPADHWCGGCHL